MNQKKRKHSFLRKIIHISVIISLIINILVFGFEDKSMIKASSAGVDYFVYSKDDYENPYIGHIGNAIMKFLDGKVSYCLQSGKGLQRGVEYTLKENLNWSLESKELLSYVLYYGYQNYYGTSKELYSDDELSYYLATQLLVWQLEYNSFYDTKLTDSLIEHYSVLKTTDGVEIGTKVVDYYKEIWKKADTALNGGTPGFTYDSDYIASLNTYTLEYNDEKDGYYIEIEDVNHYLENYQVIEDNGVEVTISGNRMTIFTQNEIEEAQNIVLNNPYFSKGMKPLIWTCNDVAFQEITNAKDVVDISKVQYLYIITKPKDNPDEEEDSENETTIDEVNTEEKSSTDPSSDEDTTIENSTTEENSTTGENGTTELNDENSTEEISTDDTEEQTTEESTLEEPENTTEVEESSTEEDSENLTTEEIEITIPELETEEIEEETEENTSESLIFEEEYHYDSDLEDIPKGRIIIEKMDGDTQEPLSGVVFLISNYENTYSITEETDENGMIDLSLPYGNYYLQEISAPPGYATNNEKISFRMTNEIPICFQIINTKVPRLGMNVSIRNLGFSVLIVILVMLLLKELNIVKIKTKNRK